MLMYDECVVGKIVARDATRGPRTRHGLGQNVNLIWRKYKFLESTEWRKQTKTVAFARLNIPKCCLTKMALQRTRSSLVLLRGKFISVKILFQGMYNVFELFPPPVAFLFI